MKPFEAAVQHLKTISGPFELDLGVLRDGFVDLENRLHLLESAPRVSVASGVGGGGGTTIGAGSSGGAGGQTVR